MKSTLFFRKVLLCLIVIYIVSTLVGCSKKKDDESEVVDPTKTEASATTDTTPPPPPSDEPTEGSSKEPSGEPSTDPTKSTKPPSGEIELIQKESEKLLRNMIPEKMNFEWRYTDGKQYGHRMRDIVSEENDVSKKIRFIGQFKDSVLDRKGIVFGVEYKFENGDITEKFTKEEAKVLHPIKELIIIKSPITEENFWQQEVNFEGLEQKVLLECKISKISEEEGKKVINIRYAAKVEGYPDGVYKEERDYKEGTGLVRYANINRDGKTFSYYLEKMEEFKPLKKGN